MTTLHTIPPIALQEMMLSWYSESLQCTLDLQWQKLSDPDCPLLGQQERKTNPNTFNTFLKYC